MDRPDFKRAAEIYIDSSIAQHGDVEQAEWEAREWWDIFEQTEFEREREERMMEDEAF